MIEELEKDLRKKYPHQYSKIVNEYEKSNSLIDENNNDKTLERGINLILELNKKYSNSIVLNYFTMVSKALECSHKTEINDKDLNTLIELYNRYANSKLDIGYKDIEGEVNKIIGTIFALNEMWELAFKALSKALTLIEDTQLYAYIGKVCEKNGERKKQCDSGKLEWIRAI